jgi:hypothetical protein
MNIARDKSTGEEIEAEDLKNLTSVDSENYECIDEKCRIQLFPCSYKKHNKTRPYFKTAKGVEHAQICGFNQYTILLKKARSGNIGKNGIIPYPYPSKLVVPTKNTFKVESELPEDSMNEDSYQPRKGSQSSESTNLIKGNRTVTAIGQIVDFYLNSPFNRDAPLQLLNLQTEYRFAFKRIKGRNENQYNGRKIYFGRVNLSKESVIETVSSLEVKLFEFDEWVESRANNYYSVLIEELTIHNKKRILSQLEIVKNEKLNSYGESKKNAYIFFLANPPETKVPYQFKAFGSQVVCRYDEILPTQHGLRV